MEQSRWRKNVRWNQILHTYSWSDALCEWHTIKMYLLINENDHLKQQEEKAEEE